MAYMEMFLLSLQERSEDTASILGKKVVRYQEAVRYLLLMESAKIFSC